MTTSCQDVRELIPLYPEDLEPSEGTVVTEHVSGCAPCAAELGLYVAQQARFRAARAERTGKVDLWAGIQAEMAKDAAAPKRGLVTSFPRRLGYVAAAAALVGGLALALQGGQPATNTPTPDPVVVKKDPVKTPAPARPARRPHRFFSEENGVPILGGGSAQFAGDREYVELDEAIPEGSTKKQRYAQQGAVPEPRGGRERTERSDRDPDRSLSF
jgi:hypothetical protein